jgi:histidyl-tRNA synthetase
MMSTIENPKYTTEDLNKLEHKIKENKAEVKDYEYLDNYLSFLGIPNFLLNKLREKNIDGYAEFIYERNLNSNKSISLLVGIALGVVSTLRKYIAGKL